MKKLIFCLFLVQAFFYSGCKKEKDIIQASGTVEITEVDVASKVAGRVTKIYVKKSDSVKAGDTLAEIDDRIINAQYDEAKAIYTQADEDFQRVKNLYGSNSVTKQKYDQTEALYTQTKARLEEAEIMKEETRIKAPWNGVIIDKYVEEGELVAQLVLYLRSGI